MSGSMPLPPWPVPIALAAVLWSADAPMWRGRREKMRPTPEDRRSFLVNNVAGAVSLAAGVAAAVLSRGRPGLGIPPALAWAGVPLALAGTALRAWAIHALGRWFTFTIQVAGDQRVVDRGPYRRVRHPGYAGALLAFLGVGLACGSWPPAVALLAPWLAAYAWRIPAEERALADRLGDAYREYQRRTWRLVPFVW